jgi:hypothetical protein
MTMIKLTPTQKTVLELSAHNDKGHIDMPENIRGGAIDMVLQGLVTKGFAVLNGNKHVITPAGLKAVSFDSLESPQGREQKNPKPGTKQALLVNLLRQPNGTTMDEMVKVTMWQKHTVRGTLSHTIKKRLGYLVESAKNSDNVRIYRIVEP